MTQPLPGDVPMFELPDDTPPAPNVAEQHLAQVRANNRARLEELARRGRGLNPLQVLSAQISAIVAQLDPEQQFAYELTVETIVAKMLTQAIEEANRAALLTPQAGPQQPGSPPGLIIAR